MQPNPPAVYSPPTQDEPPRSTALEQAVDNALDTGMSIPMLEGSPALRAFIIDMGQRIYDAEEIKRRYSLTSEELLALVARPAIRDRIRELRAVWDSGAAIDDRLRAHNGIIALEGLPVLDRFIHDATLSAPVRMDALREALRGSGIGAKKDQTPSVAGAGVSIQIILGEQTTSFSTVEAKVIDNALEAPNAC